MDSTSLPAAPRVQGLEIEMSHEFQSTLFPTVRAMCDAIATQWMTAGGENLPADIDALMDLGAQHHAEECIDAWDLLRETESGAHWLADRGATAADVLEAFERFFTTRPDLRGPVEIVGRFSHLNDTDAGRVACAEFQNAIESGKSREEAEIMASNSLQRAGYNVSAAGGATFRAAQ